MSDVVTSAGQVTDATHLPNPNEPAAAPVPETPTPAATPAPTPSEAQPERPDWLPEKFADGAALAESYKQLEQKLHNPDRQEELRTSLIEEIKAEKLEGVPDDASGYKVPEVFGGEEAREQLDPALWEATTSWAHARNLGQDDLNELVSFYTENFLPNVEAEWGKLGDNAQARANNLGAWVGANVPEEHRATLMNMAVTAENFAALEAVMKLTVPQNLPGQTETSTSEAEPMDEGAIQALMMSPAYTDPTQRDPAVVKQVDDWFKAKYPNS